MHHQESEVKLAAMVGHILLRNVHFFRQSSGLVLADFLAFRFKMCEFLPLVGWENRQLPTFLSKKKAFLNGHNNASRRFRYPIALNGPTSLRMPPDRADTIRSSRPSNWIKFNIQLMSQTYGYTQSRIS